MGQVGKNIVVAYKAESSFNTPASGGSGKQFRLHAGPGLKMVPGQIRDPEVRSDGQQSMSRLGHRTVAGELMGTLSIGTFDELIAAAWRNVFDSVLVITEATASLASITTTTNTIVAGAGSWITAGLKVGDFFRLTGHSTAANNSKNLGPIVSLSASTITLPAGQLTANAVADTAFTITRQKKLINSSTLTRASFTVEQYYSDIDDSEKFAGCRVVGIKFSWGADGVVTVTFRMMGADMAVPGSGSAPVLTSPTLTATIGLVATDATIYRAGVAIATLTACEIDIPLEGSSDLAVIGTNVTPDVYEGTFAPTITMTGARVDMTEVSALIAETDDVTFSVLMVEPESEPKDYMSVHVSRMKRLEVGAQLGSDGAMLETIKAVAACKIPTSGFDTSTISIQSVAA